MLFSLGLVLSVFRNWFNFSLIVGGDFAFIFKSVYSTYSIFPFAWGFSQGNGLGGNLSPFLWIATNVNIPVTILGKYLSFSWPVIERVAYFYPFLLIGSFSIVMLSKFLSLKNIYSSISLLCFLANTYILLLVGGGQVLLALSYAISPLVILLYMLLIDKITKRVENDVLFLSLITGLVVALQVFFDFRFAYITCVAVFMYVVYFIYNYFFVINNSKKIVIFYIWWLLIVPLFVVLAIHSFWILPTVFTHENLLQQLGSAYTSTNAVKYFSFAKFENTLSLLHPNWPENIFGLTHFFQPEFIFLPLLAFSSLFFVQRSIRHKNEQGYIIFFVFIALLGAFLAKGANPPFGNIYIWAFDHIPGFKLYRDPTKWYLLVSLSYSILIPFTIKSIHEWIGKRKNIFTKNKVLNIQNAFIFVTLGLYLFLIRPAFLGELRGTFKTSNVPNEYFQLERFLSKQNSFSRVLWVPTLERFGYYSSNHPAVGALGYYSLVDSNDVLKTIKNSKTEASLQERSVGYIVVPYDVEKEIFVKDRKYDNKMYQYVVVSLQKIPWLTEIKGFGRIHVFALNNVKDHFWFDDITHAKVSYKQINPTYFIVNVKNVHRGDKIIFAESFDSHWQAKFGNTEINSIPFENSLNSFILTKDGDYALSVKFTPQKWVTVGVIISVVSLVGIVVFLLFIVIKSRQRQKDILR